MLRRLFTVLSALSLLLCAITAVLWAGSPQHGGRAEWATAGRRYEVDRTAGGWTAHVRQLTLVPAGPAGLDEPEIDLPAPASETVRVPGAPLRRVDLPGLRIEHGFAHGGTLISGGLVFPPSGDAYTEVSVRWWLTALCAAVLPIAWLCRAARGRPRPGVCPSCGYDLRATPGRCPECGTLRALPAV